jgi:two-component system, NtrC family, response regulator PilR
LTCAAGADYPLRVPDQRARILVVDDNRELLESLVDLLRREGHEVTSATSGEEALALIEAHPFQLVLSDIAMPGLDGLELLARVRSLRPGTLVVLISAHATFDVAFDGLRKGASGFIEKPFRSQQVREAVRDALAGVAPSDPPA